MPQSLGDTRLGQPADFHGWLLPVAACGADSGGGGGATASLSPCGTKTLKSDSLTVATSACDRIAVAPIKQSNREPRRRPVLLNNSAANAAVALSKGTIRDSTTDSTSTISCGWTGPFRNSVHASALVATDSP